MGVGLYSLLGPVAIVITAISYVAHFEDKEPPKWL
jgi:hypothetical protein